MSRSRRERRTGQRYTAPLDRRFRPRVELLEDRLTPSWGATPPATIAIPSNPVAVSLNSLGDASGTGAITANENDFYRFTAVSTGSYVFTASRSGGSLDTVIGIYNSSGARVGFNDDISGSNRNSRTTISLTNGQVYYLGVTNYTGSAGGNYTWGINGPSATTTPADDRFEQNDTFSTATNFGTLTANRTETNLVMADANDYYRFTTSATGGTANSVSISFTNSQGDLDLELLNSSGARVAISEGTTNGESISLSGLAAGTYTVRVYGYQGVLNPNYSLTISPPTETTPPPPTGGFSITLRISGMSATQQSIFQQAANRWAQVIVGDIPDATYQGLFVDDVLIDASGRSIDGPGGILGQAGPDAFRSGSSLPIHGIMQFDTADLSQLESNGQLFSVIFHEMGHVLGVGTIWQARGLLTGASTTNPRFTGPRATAEYNALFGRNESGVPVENGGGSGTRNSHWRESVFDNEIMTGYIDNGFNPLSRMTIASMADIGYQVNLDAADPYTPPASLTASSTSGGGGGTTSRARGRASLRFGPDGTMTLAGMTLQSSSLDAFFASASFSLNRTNAPAALTPVNSSSSTSPTSGLLSSSVSSEGSATSAMIALTGSSNPNEGGEAEGERDERFELPVPATEQPQE